MKAGPAIGVGACADLRGDSINSGHPFGGAWRDRFVRKQNRLPAFQNVPTLPKFLRRQGLFAQPLMLKNVSGQVSTLVRA
jgi:hypothetical protein